MLVTMDDGLLQLNVFLILNKALLFWYQAFSASINAIDDWSREEGLQVGIPAESVVTLGQSGCGGDISLYTYA